ncbi:Magnesium transporter MgtE [Candidatus Kinetoplastibacterium sorsogonicusi]|uniref:Magnesium transporter MgtE n=1 Tax=Candidatus Kinetoplastidibacterium kentomonadis TaxID=1576550 RepID=A0A3Q8F688_9PROT|nr:magnesium transporter [Candidatus Kinetoplastibacterium sorsogonicusi]AWD32251.1 Magnesium transporter MgtE [Candidatus Kinetoplastibacterium sorsogonicusi]
MSNNRTNTNLTKLKLDPEDIQRTLIDIQKYLNCLDNLDTNNESYLNDLKSLINSLHSSNIAFILESLQKDQRDKLWKMVSTVNRSGVLLEIDNWTRESLIETLSFEDLIEITSILDTDELAYLADDLPLDVIVEAQKKLNPEERFQFLRAMGYPEDSVGAIMDFEMIKVREDITLEVVLRYLRRLQELPDHTDQIFVVDRQEKLQGTLSLAKILVSELDVEVKDVMDSDFLTLNPLDSDSDAASAFERYDLVSAPVMDDKGRLIGRVTVADVVDIIQEDSQEQDLSRAGLQEEDIFAPILTAIQNRAPWLLFNLCTATIASLLAARFETTVSRIVILAFLMPIVAGIGGNSGNQTMTMIIRALAVGRITEDNIWQLVKKELKVTFLVGILGGALSALFAWIISNSIQITIVTVIAMICNMLVGAVIGVLVPMLRAHFGKDPAIGSSVILTFITDSFGFFIFLSLATFLLL